MMKWFKEVISIEELRSQYKALALKNHPDVGGSVKAMQEINAEYDTLFARLKAERKEGEESPIPMMKTRNTRHLRLF